MFPSVAAGNGVRGMYVHTGTDGQSTQASNVAGTHELRMTFA